MVSKLRLGTTKHRRTLIGTHDKITKDEAVNSIDLTLYRSMIRSLLYLTTSRLDVCYSVGVCARYEESPKDSHLILVKKIIKYDSGIMDYGIWYTRDTTSSLVGYYDNDWVGNLDDRKSTSGGCFFLGKNLVSWFNRKRNCISLFIVEAEYIATGSGCTQLIWMRNMLKDYGIFGEVLTLYCDNLKYYQYLEKSSLAFEHQAHRHYYIQNLVDDQIIDLRHVSTKDQLANIFTKGLDASKNESLRSSLRLCIVK